MRFTVVFRETTTLRALARTRGDDEELFVRTRREIALLADDPHPKSAVAWAAAGIYRPLEPIQPSRVGAGLLVL